MKLSSFTKETVLSSLRMVIVMPGAVFMRLFRPNIWLITERPDQARDNGYQFFRYLKQHHPEQAIYYVIEKNAPDRKKVEAYGKTIPFDSWKHYFYYCLSKVHISAHTGGCNPSSAPICRYIKNPLRLRYVFLPHGVSYAISEFCLKKYTRIDFFVCSGKLEYENVLVNYGYAPGEVSYTGFPRLDNWHHCNVVQNQILLMPTWRLYLAQNEDTKIIDTAYHRAYQEIIRSDALSDFLTMNNLKIIFYLHHNMQKYAEYFTTDCSNIEVVYRDDQYDIQELLKSSALLITDYSSVHFDFAYMNKPVIYYQFDREEFWEKQYQNSGFDARESGFGPVADTLDSLMEYLKEAHQQHFKMQPKYYDRMRAFYELYDEHNCDRVYEEIKRKEVEWFGR